ncbi:hypothetical protein AVEN_33426-1 [Araneus ventricosus]|uniref:Uncharacterized protein n=1 Tax=Araneus ventricosus TaxID=182803 RepID=A0A4Y2ISG2_ARAVE|nr:hypothetical protein AVEN_33426-1 [Araneus ventricosus]
MRDLLAKSIFSSKSLSGRVVKAKRTQRAFNELRRNEREHRGLSLEISFFHRWEEIRQQLRKDPEKLQNILKYSRFEYTKETINKGMEEEFSMPDEEVLKSDLPEQLKKIMIELFPNKVKREKSPTLLG